MLHASPPSFAELKKTGGSFEVIRSATPLPEFEVVGVPDAPLPDAAIEALAALLLDCEGAEEATKVNQNPAHEKAGPAGTGTGATRTEAL